MELFEHFFIICGIIIFIYKVWQDHQTCLDEKIKREKRKIWCRTENEQKFNLLEKEYTDSLANLDTKLQLGNELDKTMFNIYCNRNLTKVYAENGQMFLKDFYYVDLCTFMKYKRYTDLYYQFAQNKKFKRIFIETINNKITKIQYYIL